MPIEKPDFLTHYYVDEPFRTISDLTLSQTEQVLAEIAKRRELEFRLSKSDYLPRRRRIEQAMRRGFIAKNGKPKREHPHYMVLGTFAPWEEARRKITIPLSAFSSNVLSFTLTDSFFAYSERNLRGVAIPSRPYDRQVFRLEELDELIAKYGLPGERWQHETRDVFDVYVEAQVWDDEPLREYVGPTSR